MSKGKISPQVLVNADKVEVSSLPRSLCCPSREDTLLDAKNIVCLIQELFNAVQFANDGFEAWDGLRALLNLLEDKIDIASGAYRFPLAGTSSGLPHLAERIEL